MASKKTTESLIQTHIPQMSTEELIGATKALKEQAAPYEDELEQRRNLIRDKSKQDHVVHCTTLVFLLRKYSGLADALKPNHNRGIGCNDDNRHYEFCNDMDRMCLRCFLLGIIDGRFDAGDLSGYEFSFTITGEFLPAYVDF